VLVRVAATSALDQSRKMAREYARQAVAALDGNVRREELEALTHAAVDRTR
jgi:geranylgeranyl pyrophosphate synthase